MTDETVTITLSKADADRLFNCLTHMAGWAKTRYDQALLRLEDNPRDEGHAERRQSIRHELDAMSKLGQDAQQLKDLVWRQTLAPRQEK